MCGQRLVATSEMSQISRMLGWLVCLVTAGPLIRKLNSGPKRKAGWRKPPGNLVMGVD